MLDTNTSRVVYFGFDKEVHMIEMFRMSPCLWNPHNEDYTRKDKKLSVLRHIAHQLGPGYTAGSVKTKWSNLRSAYAREIRKVRESGPPGREYVPRWIHFKRMHSFLHTLSLLENGSDATAFFESGLAVGEEISPRQTDQGMIEVKAEEDDDSRSLVVFEPSISLVCGDSAEPNDRTELQGPQDRSDQVQGQLPPNKIPRRNNDFSFPRLHDRANTTPDGFSDHPHPYERCPALGKTDECDVFGQHIANLLRGIPAGYQREMTMLALQQELMKHKYPMSNTMNSMNNS